MGWESAEGSCSYSRLFLLFSYVSWSNPIFWSKGINWEYRLWQKTGAPKITLLNSVSEGSWPLSALLLCGACCLSAWSLLCKGQYIVPSNLQKGKHIVPSNLHTFESLLVTEFVSWALPSLPHLLQMEVLEQPLMFTLVHTSESQTLQLALPAMYWFCFIRTQGCAWKSKTTRLPVFLSLGLVHPGCKAWLDLDPVFK